MKAGARGGGASPAEAVRVRLLEAPEPAEPRTRRRGSLPAGRADLPRWRAGLFARGSAVRAVDHQFDRGPSAPRGGRAVSHWTIRPNADGRATCRTARPWAICRRSEGQRPGGSTVRSTVPTLHLAAGAQVVNSLTRTPTLRSQFVFVGRLGQLTLVAYLKLLRVVIAERLWSVDDIPPPKETSP